MYWTNADTIVFYPEFNDILDIKLLSEYKKIIFSDYIFNERVYMNMYRGDSINNLLWNKSFNTHTQTYPYYKFNKPNQFNKP